MFKSYNGWHEKIEEDLTGKSISKIKKDIELAMGENFDDYMTAWIMEYNIIGRNSAQHYFSMHDKKWHKSKVSVTNSNSWAGATEPFRGIARWILKVSGQTDKQQTELKQLIKKYDN